MHMCMTTRAVAARPAVRQQAALQCQGDSVSQQFGAALGALMLGLHQRARYARLINGFEAWAVQPQHWRGEMGACLAHLALQDARRHW